LEANSLGSSDAAIEEATRKLRQKVDHLQAALEKSRGDLDTARKENEAVNARLQETRSKLADAQKEIGASKESQRQTGNQLAQAEASQGNSTAEQLRGQIADLKNEVAIAKEARAAAEKQRNEGKAKLAEVNEQVAVAGQQRDQALAQSKTESQTHQQLEALLAWNPDLKQRPGTPEKTAVVNDNSTNADELMTVKQQVTQLQQQLAESHKENQYLVARIGELSVQLDETGAQLQSAKLVGNNGGETDRLMRENELLRNIVVRERQQEARRDEARKLMLAELDKLKIKSDALNQEIELLAQPVTKLSSEELSLLRQPVLSVSGQNRDLLTAGFIFAKKSAQDLFEGEAATNQFRLNGDAGGDPQSVGHADANQTSDGATTGPQEPMSGSPDPGSE
jgi:chromosome segregation ATPase